MYQKLMHNKSLRLIGGLLGGLLLSVAINVFIVPQGLYGGGAYGLCQVIRTLLQGSCLSPCPSTWPVYCISS